MRDFLPADIRKRNYVINIIRKVYESYGFEPLETPAVENLETLMGKYGEEGNQLIFPILKRGEKLIESLGSLGSLGSLDSRESGNTSETSKTSSTGLLADLALRYDLTVPLARVVANHRSDLPKFFKRYQIQPVWRADRPARGRFREFYQCDVDAIGSTSIVVEAELIAAVSEVLERLGFKDFIIRINHREVLRAMLEVADVQLEKHADVLVILDKIDKIGIEGISKELTEANIEQPDKLLKLFSVMSKGKALDAMLIMAHFLEGHEAGTKALTELEDLITANPLSKIKIDPSLARGLSYYTGAIFEIVLTEGDFKGSIGGGGRYDGLIGMFGKEQIPACGFSLGLERILVVMDERGMFPPEIAASAAADVMVTIQSDETIAGSLRLASELREAGLRVLVYPEADKLGKQFKYADSINIPFVCVLGESELAEGKVTLKNMRTGEQETKPREEIVAELSPYRD